MWDTVGIIVAGWKIFELCSICYREKRSCGDIFKCFCDLGPSQHTYSTIYIPKIKFYYLVHCQCVF